MPVLVAPRGETVEISYPKWHAECSSPNYSVDVETGILNISGEPYQGSYEVTPTRETQTLQTASKVLAQNVTINPIPSNYGLITWDGHTLTVS